MSSSAFIVAAPLGAMDASGTGTIQSLQHTEAAHTSITHEFRIELAKTSDLFTAFSWADVNTEGSAEAGAGDANFTISLDQAKFAAALKAVIEQATGGKADASFNIITSRSSVPPAATVADPSNLGSGARNAQTVMDREIRLEVESYLDNNGVLEYLEGDSIGNFNLVLDASGGAADMAAKLGDVDTEALRNLFLQLPNRNDQITWVSAGDSRLPVKEGDAIAFVYTVSPNVKITQLDVNAPAPISGGLANSANDLTVAGMPVSGSTMITTDTRKIAFVIDVIAQ